MNTTGKFLLYLTSCGPKCYPVLGGFHPSSDVRFITSVLVCAFQDAFTAFMNPQLIYGLSAQATETTWVESVRETK